MYCGDFCADAQTYGEMPAQIDIFSQETYDLRNKHCMWWDDCKHMWLGRERDILTLHIFIIFEKEWLQKLTIIHFHKK